MNKVEDALSHKSTATFMSINMLSQPLQDDINGLILELITGQLSTLTLQPTIFNGIRWAQELDLELLKIKECFSWE